MKKLICYHLILGFLFGGSLASADSMVEMGGGKQESRSVGAGVTLVPFDGSAMFLNEITELWMELRLKEFDGTIPPFEMSQLGLDAAELALVPDITQERITFIKTLKYQLQAFSPDFFVNASDTLFLISYEDKFVGFVRHVSEASTGEEANWLDRLYIKPSYLAQVQRPILKHFDASYAYILTGVGEDTPEFAGYKEAGWVVETSISVQNKYKDYNMPAVIIKGPKRP